MADYNQCKWFVAACVAIRPNLGKLIDKFQPYRGGRERCHYVKGTSQKGFMDGSGIDGYDVVIYCLV